MGLCHQLLRELPEFALDQIPGFHAWNFPTHGEMPTNQRENDEKRQRRICQKTAALVVARFATNLVDAQGAEAAVVHEPIKVLRIWGGENGETVLMRADLIRFISKEQKMEEKWSE